MPYEPIIPEGHHLGSSHVVDGALKGHIFEDGTNVLKGHADWVRVDDPEPSHSSSPSRDSNEDFQLSEEDKELAAKIGVAVAAAIIFSVGEGVKWAAPKISSWWRLKVIPGVKDVWRHVTSGRERTKVATSVDSDAVPAPTQITASWTGIESLVADSKIKMSREEWKTRYAAMLVAGAFTEEQRRLLAVAEVEDADPAFDASTLPHELTPQQFADQISRMLVANPALLTGETSTAVMAMLEQDPAGGHPSKNQGLPPVITTKTMMGGAQ